MQIQTTTSERRERLEELAQGLRADLRGSDNPRLKALYETAAEVLLGLAKAMNDFEKKSEAAWRE